MALLTALRLLSPLTHCVPVSQLGWPALAVNSRAPTVVADLARIGARRARHARVIAVLRARPSLAMSALCAAHPRCRRPLPSRLLRRFSRSAIVQ
nr:hypothetical protein [uncultured bacterium]